MNRRFGVAAVAIAVAAGGGAAHASGGGNPGPPGGPPPSEVGPPRLIGDSRPYPIKHQKYDVLVSGSKSASKSRNRPSPSAAKAPAPAAPEETECVVISSANMQEALHGCMNAPK